MSTIGNNSSLPNVGLNAPKDSRIESRVPETRVGGGLGSVAYKVPDTKGESSQGSSSARASLTAFMFTGSQSVDTEVLLVQVAVSMRDSEATSQKAKITTDQESKKAQAQEKERKLDESQKKMAEAEEKKKSGSILDKVKLAFEWLGAVLAVATAAILMVTGVATAVGIALMAAAVVAVVMAIDSTVEFATGNGIAGSISIAVDKMNNARGVNTPPMTEDEMKAKAGKADMGFKIAMAVVGIALAIASGGQSLVNGIKNLGQAAASMARAGMTAARTAEEGVSVFKTIKDVASAIKTAYRTVMDAADKVADAADNAQKVTKLAQKIGDFSGKSVDEVRTTAKIAKTYVGAAETINDIGTTGAGVGSTTLKYQEASASADAKTIAASAKVDEAVMMLLDDMIDQALSRLMAASNRFNSMLDDITASIQDRGDTMSRARFQG